MLQFLPEITFGTLFLFHSLPEESNWGENINILIYIENIFPQYKQDLNL